jgi:hypothetical protein
MSVVAIIEDPAELAKIIERAKKKEKRALSKGDDSSAETTILTAILPRTTFKRYWRYREYRQEPLDWS